MVKCIDCLRAGICPWDRTGDKGLILCGKFRDWSSAYRHQREALKERECKRFISARNYKSYISKEQKKRREQLEEIFQLKE